MLEAVTITSSHVPPWSFNAPGKSAVVVVADVFEIDRDLRLLSKTKTAPYIDQAVPWDVGEERSGSRSAKNSILDLGQCFSGNQQDRFISGCATTVRPGRH